MKTNPDKNIFRQKGISAREGLSYEQVKAKSKEITYFLMTLPEIKDSSEIFCYLSSQGKKEVETGQFISWALEQNKNIYVPRSNWQEKTLTLHKLPAFPPDRTFFDEKFGIMEPKENYNLLEDLLKLKTVILPGTAGDLKGTRYGLKAGFYDRFLEKLSQIRKANSRTAPTPILILFEEQMFPELPREEHDFPVKIIVTDKNIYRI
ncbi:MAG: 5-formyltetrahydrofolate cyclo-ligase [bacterium]|nr:5-formyltetrahydrofolate cyclo-ligase [bacterium]